MRTINLGRVVVGGIIAGGLMAVMDALVEGAWHRAQWEVVARAHALAPGPAVAACYIAANITEGVLILWVYAATQEQLGKGLRTAWMAGLVVWLSAEVFLAGNVAIGLTPWFLHWTGSLFRLVGALVAAAIGTRLYQEVS